MLIPRAFVDSHNEPDVCPSLRLVPRLGQIFSGIYIIHSAHTRGTVFELHFRTLHIFLHVCDSDFLINLVGVMQYCPCSTLNTYPWVWGVLVSQTVSPNSEFRPLGIHLQKDTSLPIPTHV